MKPPSSSTCDRPPSAAARPALPANVSASSCHAGPPKKRKTASSDGANYKNGATWSITPPAPGDNVATGGMPPWHSMVRTLAPTARGTTPCGQGGGGEDKTPIELCIGCIRSGPNEPIDNNQQSPPPPHIPFLDPSFLRIQYPPPGREMRPP